MNWDQIEGNWKQLKGNAKQQWGKLTDDHLDVIAGKRDALSGKIQEIYGVSKDEANNQLSDWQTMLTNLAKSDEEITKDNKTIHLKHQVYDEKL
ncbi:MAG TPA: CsbD family protein [Methylotenera sp.]|nr:CsbD family protein [Methylotenera sp.]